MAGEGEHEYF